MIYRPLIFTMMLLISGPVLSQPSSTPVFVAEVTRVEWVEPIEALGTLQADENVIITSTVTEKVTRINFDDGDRVASGDLLLEMDSSEERALLSEEQSRLSEAELQIRRLNPLIAKGSAPESALDEQVLKKQTAEARMEAIEAQIRQRQILAPFDGVIGQRNISVGALVQPGTVVTTIDDDLTMKLDFSVPARFLSLLTPQSAVSGTTAAWPNEVFRGSLSSVNSRIDPVTRSISVRAILPNPDHKLRPGQLMRVRLLPPARSALMIPEEALLSRGKQEFVRRIATKDNQTVATQVQVTIGARRQGAVEILTGLAEGDQVVTHGNIRLSPGAAVEVKAVQTGDNQLVDLLSQPQSGELTQ
ncbi:efflux RND transporter periplasmic adaptor subunit [Microbulbifer discodermiae]|uniref:efflux RND transporter periplasmic adaptor subunit n=1 Tax=Microbulbifer sp. 2201CG32-9 TaxID=3232309 RepID=UPI00345B915A